MTLNDLERRNSPYFAFLRNSTDFQADYITVVEDRPIMSVKILSPSSSLLLLAKTITHPAARSLCQTWASCHGAIRLPSRSLTILPWYRKIPR